MSDAGKAVFLSYAREDAAAARRIAEALRATGLEVWFDENELRGGDAWDGKIRRQIDACVLFVPIISAHTDQRAKGYFRLEWKLAVDQMHLRAEGVPFLTPVVIDNTRESGAVVPAEFLRLQWTRLPAALPTPGFVAQVKRLLESPREVPQGSPPAFRPSGGATPALPKPRLSAWRLGAVALVILTMAGVALWRWRPASATAASPTVTDHTRDTRARPTATAPASAKSVAVLPFVNLGPDKADDYLGDGMTEELLNVLAKVKGLRVPGRSSSFAFKGRTDPDIFSQVGQQLRVGTVLEGSVRKTGNRVRITAQLINVADGFHLWSETYDRDLTDLLAIQSDVAQRVVQALQVTLGVEESRALARKPTDNPEAHRLYLLGRHHWHRNNEAGWQNAIKYFEEAIRLDPAYAPAYIGLADTYSWMAGNVMSGREGSGKQVQLARQALAIEPDSADAHASMALGLAGDFDWPGAEQAVRRALQLNPNLGRAHDAHGYLLLARGMADEAVATQRAAVAVDPLSPLFNLNLAWGLYFARRDDEAIAQIRKTQELEANFGHGLMGLIHCWRAEFTEAVNETEIAKSAIFRPRIQADLGYIYAMSGDRGKAQAVLSELDALARRRYVQPGARVRVHLALGEHDKVFELLEWCAAERDSVCFELKVDRAYDSLRSDRRYQVLLRKIGLE